MLHFAPEVQDRGGLVSATASLVQPPLSRTLTMRCPGAGRAVDGLPARRRQGPGGVQRRRVRRRADGAHRAERLSSHRAKPRNDGCAATRPEAGRAAGDSSDRTGGYT